MKYSDVPLLYGHVQYGLALQGYGVFIANNASGGWDVLKDQQRLFFSEERECWVLDETPSVKSTWKSEEEAAAEWSRLTGHSIERLTQEDKMLQALAECMPPAEMSDEATARVWSGIEKHLANG